MRENQKHNSELKIIYCVVKAQEKNLQEVSL